MLHTDHAKFRGNFDVNWPTFTIEQIKDKSPRSCVGGPFGSDLTTRDYVEDGVPVIRGNNLSTDDYFDDSEFVFVSVEKANFLSSNTAFPGDLVFTQRGTLGQVALIPEQSIYRKYVISQSQMKLTVNREFVLPEFVYWWFRQPSVIEMVRRRAITSGVPHINLGILKSFGLKIPSLEEQNKIVKTLREISALFEKNRRRIFLLEESARLLYREWFVHLRFPGHEHVKVVDGVPEGWGLRTIADMFVTTSGGTPSRANPEYFDGATNWVKTQELDDLFIFDTEEHISESAIKNSAAKIFPAGTLLVSIYGGTNIGRTGLLAVPAASNQACVALMPKKNGNDVYFAQKWLQENKDYLVGLGQGAAQTNISQQTLRSQAMLVPGEGLLNEFTSHAQQAYQQIANLCLQNRRLREARDLLLPRLMSGEIQV